MIMLIALGCFSFAIISIPLEKPGAGMIASIVGAVILLTQP